MSKTVVVAVDSDGNVTSKPLSRLPPATILSVAQESTPQLQKLIADKWEFTASRIKSLQRLVDELKMGAATFNQSRPEGVELQGRMSSAERWAAPKEVATENPIPANEKNTEEVLKERYQSFAFLGSFDEHNSPLSNSGSERELQTSQDTESKSQPITGLQDSPSSSGIN